MRHVQGGFTAPRRQRDVTAPSCWIPAARPSVTPTEASVAVLGQSRALRAGQLVITAQRCGAARPPGKPRGEDKGSARVSSPALLPLLHEFSSHLPDPTVLSAAQGACREPHREPHSGPQRPLLTDFSSFQVGPEC